MVQADSCGRFHPRNGVISSHNRLNIPFSSSKRMPIYKGSMEEARCGAVFPGDASEVAQDSRRLLTFRLKSGSLFRSYTLLVNRMLLGYEYTSRNRCESGLTFSMGYADELLSPKVCKIHSSSKLPYASQVWPLFRENHNRLYGS